MNALRASIIVLLPTLILATVIITDTSGPLQAAAKSMPTARAAGIMVNYPVADREENGMPALAFTGTMSKTRLALVIDNPEGGIIGFRRESSKTTTFADNTGKSLQQADSAFGPFAFGERIVQDGKRLILTLESDEAPMVDARSIEAAGVIDITVAHEKKTYTTQMVPAVKGHGLQAGPIRMTIHGYEKSDWNDGMELTVETRWNVDAITKYTALLEDGTRSELRRTSTMSFNGKTNLSLASKVDLSETFALEIETWHNPQQLQVPFKVEASVGLR